MVFRVRVFEVWWVSSKGEVKVSNAAGDGEGGSLSAESEEQETNGEQETLQPIDKSLEDGKRCDPL
jgi:hypothetical protein